MRVDWIHARAVSVCVRSAVLVSLRMSIMWSLKSDAYNDLRFSSGLCFEQDFKPWWDTSCPVKGGRFLVAVQQRRNAICS